MTTLTDYPDCEPGAPFPGELKEVKKKLLESEAQLARMRIERQRQRQIQSIGHHTAELLRELESLDVATVPDDLRAGLKTALCQLSVLSSRKSHELLTLSSTPAIAGSAAVSPRGAGSTLK